VSNPDALNRLLAILREAQVLAASDSVIARVAGERISAIVADVLYEIDPDLEDVTALLPPMRRVSVQRSTPP
jgi:hypothetical protein